MYRYLWDLRHSSVCGRLLGAVLSLVLLLSLLFLPLSSLHTALIPTASEREARLLILDAGHGGEDSGTVSADGICEKDLNLAYVRTLGEYLTAAGYAIIYTREQDVLLYDPLIDPPGRHKQADLRNRQAVADEYPEAVFISLHMNAYPDRRQRGTQVYYGVQCRDSRTLGLAVQERVVTALQPWSRRTAKTGEGIYLTEHISQPVILIECGFLSTPAECELLCQTEYRERFCRVVAEAVCSCYPVG